MAISEKDISPILILLSFPFRIGQPQGASEMFSQVLSPCYNALQEAAIMFGTTDAVGP
jgi:hypothetical protein